MSDELLPVEPTPQPEAVEVVAEEAVEPSPTPVALGEEYTPKSIKQNYVLDREISQPRKEGMSVGGAVSLFRELGSVVVQAIEQNEEVFKRHQKVRNDGVTQARKLGVPYDDSKESKWYLAVSNAIASVGADTSGEAILNREGSEWHQRPTLEGKPLHPVKPKQTLGAGNYTNDELLAYVTKRAGIGTTIDWPLWHSGIWVRMKMPKLGDIAVLKEDLARERLDLGNSTRGIDFSNLSHYGQITAANFALAHVIDANVHFKTPSDLADLICTRDTQMLLTGLAATMFMNGFDYSAPCMADPGVCEHVVEECMVVPEMHIVDWNSISKWQRSFMARRLSVKATPEELERYRKESPLVSERIVWLGDIGVSLREPTITAQDQAGKLWIDGIVELTQGAFNEPPHGQNRNMLISQIGETTIAAQYAHWIDAIVERREDGEEPVVLTKDRAGINTITANVLSDEQYAEKFGEAVIKFINDTTVSMVAVHNYNCPNCNTPRATAFKERFPNMVPVDALNLFFILVSLKVGN